MIDLDVSLPSVILTFLTLSMIFVSATAEVASRKTVLSPRIIPVTIIVAFCLKIRNHFHLHGHNFLVLVSYMISAFFPYLRKPSKHRRSFVGSVDRNWNDQLMTTSSSYLLSAVFAFSYGQFEIALICFITYIGSSLYHRHREMEFFNLDNIFATSLLFTCVYTLVSSYFTHEIYFIIGLMGLPTAMFLIVYCGMPADIRFKDIPGLEVVCCVRTGRELYDTVHALWHLASSVGPCMAVWYFHFKANEYDKTDMSDLNKLDDQIISRLPYLALSLSIFANIAGNIDGIMPLE
uniref:Uncharacterized protein n=1 Tax=Spumella elongata TaxID=89044 RepID=A0A7S3HNL6_9STRA|mmetsp:Transcript_6141/g.10325  ORF Transcript_6141/g.10325 Transcript_6141/m.10325 type:complete len:292 (+) Transcript_6141:81-956(+)